MIATRAEQTLAAGGSIRGGADGEDLKTAAVKDEPSTGGLPADPTEPLFATKYLLRVMYHA